MRRAFLTDIVRSVRGSAARFLAIMGIVALGCGFYAGLRMCGPDMRAAADALYDGTNLWDLRLMSTMGLSSDDVGRVREIPGVRGVMPSVTCDAIARLGSEQVAVRISSLDCGAAGASAADGAYAVASDDASYLNRPRLVEGSWPCARGECVISADVPAADYGLGDRVELLYGTSDLDELLGTTELTIVGTVSSPDYPYTGSFGSTTLGSGMISQYLFVGPASLATDAPYTELYLTVEGAAAETSESDAYQEVVGATKASLERAAARLAAARQDDLRTRAQETLDERWAEYDDERARAERELADAKEELEAAAAQIADGEHELAAGEEGYRDGVATLRSQRANVERRLDGAAAEVARNQRTLDDRWAELGRGERELARGRAAYERGLAALLTQTGATSLDEARAGLAEHLGHLDAGIAQLEEGIAQAEGAPAQAQAAIDAAEAGVAEAQAGMAQADEGIGRADAALAGLTSQRASLEGQQAQLLARQAQLEQMLASAPEESREQIERELDQVGVGLAQAQAALAQVEGGIAEASAAKAQAEEGRRQAEEGLARAQEGLAQAQAALAAATEAQAQLPSLRAQLDDLRQRRSELAGALAGADELAAAKAQLDASQAQLDAGRSQLEDGAAKLRAARSQLDSGRASAARELARAQAQLDDARGQLDDAGAQLADARARYEDGRTRYEDGRAEADETFSDALAQLGDAQREIDELDRPDIYAIDRTKSEGAATYHADARRMDSIAAVFPFVFFLVAALVSLTTMTRMVEDDRVQIGTYKALGYGTAAIASKYLAYAGVAGTIGAALGILLLSQVLPLIVMNAYSIIYTVPIQRLPLPVDLGIALSAGGLGVGVTLLATWGAVLASLREVPATLMLPRAPKAGKRILLERLGPVWGRLSFTWKVTCRNLFRYKRRFLMTVIGIAGCAALLLVGFGLHDSIWDIIDRQYGPIIHYDTTVGLDDDATEIDVRRACDYLASTGEVDGIVRVQNENMQAGTRASDETIRVNAVIPRDTASMARAVTLRNRVTGERLVLDDDAVLVTEKLAIKYGLAVGDEIVLFDQDDVGTAVGPGHALTVTGVAENYVGNYVYLGRSAWASVSDGVPAFSTIYASTTPDDAVRRDIAARLPDLGGVSTVAFTDETIAMYRTMLSVVDMIVVVLIVSAAALAHIVLYNLTNINIDERVREIASLKVLGFTRREVSSYIFREIALLAVLGDALGMVLGIFLERFVVTTAEVDYVMFGRSIHPTSFAYAFVLTLAFTGLVILSMRRKLDRVDMVESLKSVD